MKKYSFLLLILISFAVHAQESDTQDATNLPVLIPVSPDAASLGKYGDLPINLSVGKINLSVPIFTVNSDGFNLPIYLSYNHNGLLIEEDPGIVGMGWTLVAGGRVTRQMFGKPDNQNEHLGNNNKYVDIVDMNNGNYDQNSTFLLNAIISAANNTDDAQPDKFIMNVSGLDGSFFYNEHGKAVFLNHKNIIVKQPTSNNFEILNDTGVKYFFNDYEETVTDINSQISSWNISEIELPNKHKTINFSYYDAQDLNFNPNRRYYNKTTYFEHQQREKNPFSFQTTGVYGCPNTLGNELVERNETEVIIYQKLIKSIAFTEGKVDFDIRIVPSIVDNIPTKVKNPFYLNSIIIYDKYDKIISKFTFEYADNEHITNYNLLKQIHKFSFNTSTSSFEEAPYYRFEYYDSPPEEINYVSQDIWGYYTGRTSTNLFTADKTPDFNSTLLGALKNVYYPTGGFSQLEYEQNTVANIALSYQDGGYCATNPLNLTKTLGVNSITGTVLEKTASLYIEEEQVVKISLQAIAGSISDRIGGMSEANLTVVDQYGNVASVNCDPINTCNDGCRMGASASAPDFGDPENDNTTSYFKIPAGSTINMFVRCSDSSEGVTSASIAIDYWDGIKEKEVGGIRVKSLKTCGGQSAQNCNTKYYKYVDELGKSSGMLLSFPQYRWETNVIGTEEGGTCSLILEHKGTNSKIPLAGYSGSPVLYKRVEIIQEDGHEMGKEVNYYTGDANTVILQSPFPPINYKDWQKGQLSKKEIYKWIGNSYKLIEKTENTYLDVSINNTDDNHVVGLVATRYLFGSLTNDDILTYDHSFYDFTPEFWHLTNTATAQYDEGNETLVTETQYFYDSETGYVKKQTTTDSNHKVIEVENSYPNDIENANSLGNISLSNSELQAYNNMKSPDDDNPNRQNMIATPIQVSKKINGEQLSLQRTIYKNWGEVHDDNGDIIQNKYINTPQRIMASKGDNLLEDKIIYHNYDDWGNPTEVSQTDGIHIYYIWGYEHTKPIAKIINFTKNQADNLHAIIDNAIEASNNDNDSNSEDNLRTKLQALRNALPSNTQMVSFTYDPLIGVTSVTDPKEDTQYYHYDSFNRLQYVKDTDGHVLKENEYHYRTN